MRKSEFSLTNNHVRVFILIAAIGVLLIHHVFAYTGHYGYDDMHYAKLAIGLLNGEIDYNDHYSFRWPILIFTALAFKLGGVHDSVAAIPSLVISTGTIYLVYRILKNHSIQSLIIGLGICVFDGWSLHYSDKIMPDVYISLAILSLVYCVYSYKFGEDDQSSMKYAWYFAFILMFGFMAKETMLLILPLLGFWFITDVILKRDLNFWKWSVLCTVFLFVLYLGLIYLLTGSGAQRFTAILQNPYLSLCSYSLQSASILMQRIGYQFFEMLIAKGMFVAPGLLLIGLFSNWRKDILWFNDSQSFFYTSFLVLVLSGNFMSTSASSYNPLCLDPRHYLFLIPLAAIPVSIIMAQRSENKPFFIKTAILFLILSIISKSISPWECKFLYLPLFCFFLIYVILLHTQWYRPFLLSLFPLLLIYKLSDKIRYADELNFSGQQKVVKNFFLEQQNACYVITDEVQKRLTEYYNGFSNTSGIRFLKFNAFLSDTLDADLPVFIILNAYTQQLSNLHRDEIPYYARITDSTQLVYTDPSLGLNILRSPKLSTPQLLLTFSNGFENQLEGFNPAVRSTDQKFKGAYSNTVEEYSFTYEFSMDSISCAQKYIMVDFKASFLKEASSGAVFVVSLDQGSAPYVYHSESCDHYIKAYSNWATAGFSKLILRDSIRSGSKLKAYVWNPEKQTFYLDDFEIKLYCLE